MKTILVGTTLLALATTAAGAADDPKSANYMMPGCKLVLEPLGRSQDTFSAGDCIGTIQGIAFVLGWNPGGFCCRDTSDGHVWANGTGRCQIHRVAAEGHARAIRYARRVSSGGCLALQEMTRGTVLLDVEPAAVEARAGLENG